MTIWIGVLCAWGGFLVGFVCCALFCGSKERGRGKRSR
ncbi:hypothetical protein SAMN05444424_2949 [Bittarella massiliensis (ex Durand et al. 2017)]|uniref:DUF3789 domain-containing protein n=1 Tax=Bittarella massiliensis (ex Durand et al. 2017) TaxID=1720313 RepID=A0AAQ1MGG3_9FIRM|nr:hypothetical protein SAMN05444424_2949 [Bittarella massiliensis (ex Durand et al. 2017)]